MVVYFVRAILAWTSNRAIEALDIVAVTLAALQHQL
jgi:hypothetical protein